MYKWPYSSENQIVTVATVLRFAKVNYSESNAYYKYVKALEKSNFSNHASSSIPLHKSNCRSIYGWLIL